MSYWIFKVIWMPVAVIVGMCCAAVLAVIFKDVGWGVPFRWLCIIGAVAFIADKAVNA